ncbi:hypothetical protein I4U23_012464 [Adineta vaga]|nr:hypothetical protein I4U23_012464 [Adineta vaga]
MTESISQPTSTLGYIQTTLEQISTPYVIIVSSLGIAGNVLTIIMLSKRSLTKNFNNCTLIALGAADLLFNLTLVSLCINKLSGLNSNKFCRFLSFTSHLAELLSACFTAHFTIQRFIAVRFPLSVFMEKNVHVLHYVVETLTILFGVTYCYNLVENNVYDGCEEGLALKWFISDALLSFAIPFLIIATLNLLIIFHLRRTSRQQQELALNNKRTKHEVLPLSYRKKSSVSIDSNSPSRLSDQSTKSTICHFTKNGVKNSNYLSVRKKTRRATSIRSTTRSHAQSHRVTRMLILVSTCFLLLNAPCHICTISFKILRSNFLSDSSFNQAIHGNFSSNLSSSSSSVATTTTITTQVYRENSTQFKLKLFRIFYIILIVSQHVSYLSYSINFFLYSFCGMKFRRELMRFFSRCRHYREQISIPSTLSGPHLL